MVGLARWANHNVFFNYVYLHKRGFSMLSFRINIVYTAYRVFYVAVECVHGRVEYFFFLYEGVRP